MNLLTYIFIAVACSTVYYLINFYVKYLPGDIFINQVCNSWSQILANVVTIYLTRKCSIKKGLLVAFTVTTVACGMVIFA